MNKELYLKSLNGAEIAIIGYALRFPGASSGEEFWQNLVKGEESIHFLTDEELDTLHVPAEIYRQEGFVKAVVKAIPNKEYFDYSFFGYTPEEARAMDPQMRIFHELVWEALEHSGQAGQTARHKIGLFAGAASSFSHELITMAAGLNQKIGQQIASRLVNKDYLCSRIAYALNLKGPCYTLQTACSTSLVAVHVAARSILTGECKMALAGGISIQAEQNKGYLYEEGGILSADGHCSAFDANSSGTLFGDGGCVVMLKRLKDAIQDNDTIHGVIKASAINNDGNRKVGFTAPSIEGQVDVIKLAHKIAKVAPEEIQYVEAHGTGTRLGDPIELQALQAAFNSPRPKFCAIGSVKTNVGHLDTAAGIAGLMKVVLALKHKQIPPSLNYKNPNPNVDFDSSPFYVNQTLTAWHSESPIRKAGVSSFGIGGTNAHLVLEEAPEWDVSNETIQTHYRIIPVSAKTRNAGEQVKESLVNFLKENSSSFSDLANSLQRGRKHFAHRSFVVARDTADVIEEFRKRREEGALFRQADESSTPVVFMFGGQGSQYYGITKDLYTNFLPYRREVDQCLSLLPGALADEIKNIILIAPSDSNRKSPNSQIPTRLTQPLLFVIEYALAKVLISSGITPEVMIGHSIGEYVAACISEVISLNDALDLVAYRGQIMEQTRAGAMLSVKAPANTLNRFLQNEVAFAAINSNNSCVLSGSVTAIDEIEQRLVSESIPFRRLRTNKAFHSALMDEVLPAFLAKAKSKTWNAPRIPFISNITGKFATAEEVIKPEYWVKHLRNTVEFAQGLRELGNTKKRIFIEVGTGKNLGTFVKEQGGTQPIFVDLIRHPKAEFADDFFFMKGLGDLWCAGKELAWEQLYPDTNAKKIPLPGYPFERSRFWNDFTLTTLLQQKLKGLNNKKTQGDNLAYVPVWKRSPLPYAAGVEKKNVLIFSNESEACLRTSKHISDCGHGIKVVEGTNEKTWKRSLETWKQQGFLPEIVLTFVGVEHAGCSGDCREFNQQMEFAMAHILLVCKTLNQLYGAQQMQLKIVTCNSQDVIGGDVTMPHYASLLGIAQVASIEFKNLVCSVIDSDEIDCVDHQKLLTKELVAPISDVIVAFRRGYRWIRHIESATLLAAEGSRMALPSNPTILITGGPGGMGLELSRHLINHYQATIIFIGHSEFPARDSWKKWIEVTPEDDPVSKRIAALLKLEADGGKVIYYNADVSDCDRMKEVIENVNREVGQINGVVHVAGTAVRGALALLDADSLTDQMSAKAAGVFVLQDVLRHESLSFFVNFSSLNSFKPFFGQGGYAASNAVLEAFCHSHSLQCDAVKTISWDTFGETGMALQTGNGVFDNLHAFRFDLRHPLINYLAKNSHGQTVGVSYLSAKDLWVLREHRIVAQQPTLPAKAYIEVVYAILQRLHPGSSVVLRNVFIIHPLVMNDSEERKLVKTLLERKGDHYSVKIVSRKGSVYQEHARVEAEIGAGVDSPRFTLGKLVVDGTEADIASQPQDQSQTAELGPRWRTLKRIKLNSTEGLALLELQHSFHHDVTKYLLHPALVDTAAGFLYMAKKGQRSYLPYYYESISIYSPIPAKIYSHVILRTHDDDSITFDVHLMDMEGNALMVIRNYTYKAYTNSEINKNGVLPKVSSDMAQENEQVEKVNGQTHGLTTAQVITWFEKAVISGYDHLIVSTQNCDQFTFGASAPADEDSLDNDNEKEIANDGVVLQERDAISTAFIAASTETQKSLVEDWQQFFGIKQIGVLDDFFELGGDSLKSTTIISRINKRFKVSISLTDFFKNSTIRKLAEYIDLSSPAGKLYLPKKAEKKSYYPLSAPQQRIYFLQRLYANQTSYNITEAFKLHGTLDPARVEETIHELLQRHESLRVKIVLVNKLPFQQILDSVTTSVEYHEVDESGISEALHAFRRPFDFTRPPYIRFGIFKTQADSYYFIVDMLHIVADGTSLLILIKEFWQIYHRAALLPVAFSQVDYAEWQSRLMYARHFEKQKSFWKRYLADTVSKVALPFDSVITQPGVHTGGNCSLVLSPEISSSLREIVRKHETTEFTLIVALLNIFLSKLTGQRDIIIGIPTAGRTHEEFNETVGMFVNTTVIRNVVNQEQTFSTFLDEVTKNALLVFDNQDFPYESIVDMVRQDLGQSTDSLFNVLLNYRNMFVNRDSYQGNEKSISAATAGLEDTSAKYDMTFFVYDNSDHFSLTCNYPTASFNPATINFLMNEFLKLARQVAASAENEIKDIALFENEVQLTADHQASVFDM